MERVRGQHQITVVAAAVAGATFTVADGDFLTRTPEVIALLCLLYVGLALAVLRHDQEITIIADHILNQELMGPEALVQAGWEAHKNDSMQGSGPVIFMLSTAQTVGIYGVPVLGLFTAGAVTLRSDMNFWTWFIMGIAIALSTLFAAGAMDVWLRYRRLGAKGAYILLRARTP